MIKETSGRQQYLEQLRERAAIAAMQGMFAAPYSLDRSVEGLPKAAIAFGDALVKALYPKETA